MPVILVLILSSATFVSMKGSRVLMMLFVVATQNLVGVLASNATRTRYFSYYSLGESSASIIGPICVGLAIDGVIGVGLGMAPIFWTCAMLMGGGSFLNRRQKI